MSLQKEFSVIEQKLTDALRSRVSEDAFARWFKEISLMSITETEIVIRVKDVIHQVWIEENYADMIQDVVLTVLGETKRVLFAVGEDAIPNVGGKVVSAAKESKGKSARITLGIGEKAVARRRAGGLNPLYTFSNFVVGANSQFAKAAAQAVADSLHSPYNPLFIHGASGLGKTHLMQAIGNHISAERGVDAVVYLTCEQFTNEFIDAIQNNNMAKFRRKYRKAEVLLLDDVQFFGGRERSQEEFFHTFNSLFNGHKHIVLTSDRPACEIARLEPRLVSRFECGLTVEIQTPDLETRVAILRQKRDDMKVRVDDHVIQFLAERIRKNVRRLEGALMRIATFASLSGETPTFDRIESLLRDILREENHRAITIDLIQRTVAEHFDVRLADMTSRRRPANIAFARQVAMFLSRRMTKASLVEIGEAFGGRDHGTVIHAIKTIEAKIATDSQVRDTIERLESLLS